jgi:hypothetical protein
MKFLSWRLALCATVLSLSVLACGGQDGAGGRVSIVLSSSGETVASTASSALTGGAVATFDEDDDQDHDDVCTAPQAASVTFSSILARTLDGVLVDVTIDLPVTVDLLALVNGKEATLPAGSLLAGTYDQIVVVMTQLEVTLASGTKIAVTPPGGGWTAVVNVAPPFTVTDGEITPVALDFRRDRSFGCRLGAWDFRPEFECRPPRDHD